ncbi:MAG: four helix bundle protein [Calditrichaceae bacterium]|nr:four helix bundle protein [Calditrichia bacterium]NUQ40381.1 four helix bundle protein [Calditrichaceae bacterium]
MNLKLEELQVYQLAMEMAERIWNIVIKWDYFAKDVIGKQLMKAVDSMAANLSEGYGRFFYKENKQFCYYSRGSLFETKTWLIKAHNRKLINTAEFDQFIKDLDAIGIKLNNYIHSIGKKGGLGENPSQPPNDHQ